MADERDPAERVRRLVQYAGQVEVDNSIEPKKYFRSGVEMERMVRIICQVMGYEIDCVDVCMFVATIFFINSLILAYSVVASFLLCIIASVSIFLRNELPLYD